MLPCASPASRPRSSSHHIKPINSKPINSNQSNQTNQVKPINSNQKFKPINSNQSNQTNQVKPINSNQQFKPLNSNHSIQTTQFQPLNSTPMILSIPIAHAKSISEHPYRTFCLSTLLHGPRAFLNTPIALSASLIGGDLNVMSRDGCDIPREPASVFGPVLATPIALLLLLVPPFA